VARTLSPARRADRRLVLVRGSSAVQRFLQFAALTEHFQYVADPEAALAVATTRTA